MAHTTRIIMVPRDASVALYAQVGSRGAARWWLVGTVSRSDRAVAAAFDAPFQPFDAAWAACSRDAVRGQRVASNIRFGVRAEQGSIEVIAEGKMTARDGAKAAAIWREAVAAQASKSAEGIVAKTRTWMKGSGPRRPRSAWPTPGHFAATRSDALARRPAA